jgi:hypothetical protein
MEGELSAAGLIGEGERKRSVLEIDYQISYLPL